MKKFVLSKNDYLIYGEHEEKNRNDFYRGLEVNTELLDETDCQTLLYLLSNAKYPPTQEKNLLEIAHKASGEIHRINEKGQKESIAIGIDFLNAALVARGVQIKLTKDETSKYVYVNSIYDEHGVFSIIRDLLEEIYDLEEELNLG